MTRNRVDHPVRLQLRVASVLRAAMACCLLMAVMAAAVAGEPPDAQSKHDLHIPQTTLGEALSALAEQADAQLLFPHDLAGTRGVTPVEGRYTISEALEILLRHTGLIGRVTASGVITVAPGGPAQEKNRMERGNTNTFLSRLSAFALAAFGAVGVGAQTTGTQNGGLEEVIVTAQKREQANTRVGMSIAALSAETIERRDIQSVADLSRIVPSLSYAPSQNNTPVYTIRGVGFNDSALATAPTVSVYVDQIPLPYGAMTQGGTMDLERIEVLKGPQGTLFGQNSTAGAINYIVRKPTDTFEAGGSLTYGRFDRLSASGYVSGPIAPTLQARFAVMQESGDEWQRSITRADEIGKVDRTTGRLLLDWQPADSLSLAFQAYGYRDESDPLVPILVQVLPSNPARALPSVLNAPLPSPDQTRRVEWSPDTRPFRDDDYLQLSLRADWDIGDAVTLTSITANNDWDSKSLFDRDGMVPHVQDYGLTGSIESFYQELRLAGEAGALQWVVGGNYSDDTIDDVTAIHTQHAASAQSVGGVWVNGTGARSHQKVRSKSIFVNGEYQLTEQLTAIAGVRYTEETRRGAGCQTDNGNGAAARAFASLRTLLRGLSLPDPNPFVAGGCITMLEPLLLPGLVNVRLEEDNVPWTLGLNFNPLEGSLLYARISEGYKAGSIPSSVFPLELEAQPVVQERLRAYEVGFKSHLMDRRVYVEGATYYYDYKDKQLFGRVFDPVFRTPLPTLRNIPKSRVYGAEMSATTQVTRDFSVNASLTYTNTKIEEFVGYDPLGVLRDLSGERFNFTPKWQAQAGAHYEWDVSVGLRAFVGADVIYRSSATSAIGDSRDLFPIDAYTLVDLQAGVQGADGRWSLTLWGKNVTDEFYWTTQNNNGDSLIRWPGSPATYGMTARVKL